MALRRLLVIVPLILLLAGAGTFGVLYARQRTNEAHLRQQLASLSTSTRAQLAQERALGKRTTTELLAEQRRVSSLRAALAAAATTTTSPAPVVLADSTLLAQDLVSAATQLTGSGPTSSQVSGFVAEYHSLEFTNAELRAEGRTYTALDPMSEAEAFVEAHDEAAMVANNYAQVSGLLQCMINTGGTNCPNG